MPPDYSHFPSDPSKWSALELAQAGESVGQVTARLPDDEHAKWLQRLKALDNLLTLFGLMRHAHVFAGGFLIFHPSCPTKTRWIAATESEEAWMEDVKLLAK